MLQIAGTLALLAVVGKFYAAPALAQVRAAIVQDRDQRGRNFYQSTSNCQNVTSPCVIAFQAVPAGKRLIIEHVSALGKMSAANTLAEVELRGGLVFQFLALTAAPANYPGQFSYIADAQVLAAYDVGQVPSVDMFSTSGSLFTGVASISGYMIDIP
jgi:hypothetical protein